MTETKLSQLKEERSKLIDAWITASPRQKSSLLIRISDIDDELERRELVYEQK